VLYRFILRNQMNDMRRFLRQEREREREKERERERERERGRERMISCYCCVDRYLTLWTFYFGHCVVCSSSIYGLWLPIWYLLTLITDLQFYIDIIFRIELYWRLCLRQLVQLCFSKFTSTVCFCSHIFSLLSPSMIPIWYLLTLLVLFTP
jgi:hypothetical protein